MGLSKCVSYTRFLGTCFAALPPLAIKLRLRRGLTCLLFEVLLGLGSAEKRDVCYLFVPVSFSSTEPFERPCIAVSVVLLRQGQRSWESVVTYCVTLSPSCGVTLAGLSSSLSPTLSQQREMLPACTCEVP